MMLIYDTLEEAQQALDMINTAMGFTGNITTTWADIIQNNENGKFEIPEPPIEVEGIYEGGG